MTINDILTKYGLTMTEISRRYNIPYRTLQNWKEGKREAPDYVLTLLDKALESEKGDRT